MENSVSIEENIILGIFTGIVTSALIFLCASIFNKVLIPWYRAAIYRGLDINGDWKAQIEYEDHTDSLTLNIKQKEQHISGMLSVVKVSKQTQETTIKNLSITGIFQDGHLMLIGNNSDRRFRAHVAYLFSVTQGGLSLTGNNAWVDSGNGSVNSSSIRFNRENA